MIDMREYGKALFLITEEERSSDKVLADVKIADKVLKDNPEYIKLLDSPAVPKEERVSLVDRAFGTLDTNLLNLVKILTQRRLICHFNKVAEAYYGLYDESRGILRVVAVTAIPLSEGQTKALTRRLSETLGKTIVLHNTVDRGILGGVTLRYSGVQLDGSIKTRLDKFEQALKQQVI